MMSVRLGPQKRRLCIVKTLVAQAAEMLGCYVPQLSCDIKCETLECDIVHHKLHSQGHISRCHAEIAKAVVPDNIVIWSLTSSTLQPPIKKIRSLRAFG